MFHMFPGLFLHSSCFYISLYTKFQIMFSFCSIVYYQIIGYYDVLFFSCLPRLTSAVESLCGCIVIPKYPKISHPSRTCCTDGGLRKLGPGVGRVLIRIGWGSGGVVWVIIMR